MYAFMKFVHVFGAVLLVGNAIVSALWKTAADRTGDVAVIRAATRTLIRADRAFTIPGVVLILIGGYAMAGKRPWPLHGLPWLEGGQAVFYLAVLLWLIVLVPAQRKMAALAEAAQGGTLPDEYRRASRTWAMWGGIVTLLLVIVLYLMNVKP